MPTVPIFNSSLSLVKGSPLNVQADCIVNAAIPTLKPTPGICNAIYKAADTAKLKEACSAIGDCKPGKIAVTDSCGLPFFCILHAVAPVMIDGKYKENKLLTDCYRQCIEFAADKNLHSIVFPLLGSAKVSGFPPDKAWRIGLKVCAEYLLAHRDSCLHITFAVQENALYAQGEKEFRYRQRYIERKLKDSTDPSTDQEDLPQAPEEPHGDPPFALATEQAIHHWHQTGQVDTVSVIQTVLQDLTNGVSVLLPWILDVPLSELSGEETPEGRKVTLTESRHFHFRELCVDGMNGLIAYTSRNVLPNPDMNVIPLPLKDVLDRIQTDSKYNMLAINLPGEHFGLESQSIRYLLQQFRPKTQDEIELEMAEKAENLGDYAEAFRCLQRAAMACNPRGLRNLGAYYHDGLGVPVNMDMARQCWEKAAILGDPLAVYTLGDMFRNGEQPRDIVYSRALYFRAYELTKQGLYPAAHPEACIRLLRHCSREISPEDRLSLAREAVDGYRNRIQNGDSSAESLLREAQSYLQTDGGT